MTKPCRLHDKRVICPSAKLAAFHESVYTFPMRFRTVSTLVVATLSITLIPANHGWSQIESTLFGDNLGPAIDELPDTGDAYVVVEPEESRAPVDPLPDLPPTTIPDSSTLPPTNIAPPPEATPSTPPPPALPEAKKPRRSWLPWGNKRREREERLQAERERTGPRLGKLRSGESPTGGQVDSGLLPSELRRWKRDPRQAMREARAERKLLLLWMTDSVRSSTSKTMATELFRHTRFLRMAKDYMVLAKIDFAESDIASHPYTRHVKKELNVMGYPFLVLFSPDSKEMWRFRGYRRGRFPLVLDELQHQVKVHALRERERHQRLVEKGYRDWTNDRNEAVFAKAVEVSREDREVVFMDPYGKKHRYPVVLLSKADRDWLAETFLR